MPNSETWTVAQWKEYQKTGLKPGQQVKEKPSKYKNKKVIINDIPFDSIGEGNRYKELLILETAGKICDLRLQVRFKFIGKKFTGEEKIMHYIADFVYFEQGVGIVVEDFKGYKTEVYEEKKKLMKLYWNIDIKET